MLHDLVSLFFGANPEFNMTTMLEVVMFVILLFFIFKLLRLFTRGL